LPYNYVKWIGLSLAITLCQKKKKVKNFRAQRLFIYHLRTKINDTILTTLPATFTPSVHNITCFRSIETYRKYPSSKILKQQLIMRR